MRNLNNWLRSVTQTCYVGITRGMLKIFFKKRSHWLLRFLFTHIDFTWGMWNIMVMRSISLSNSKKMLSFIQLHITHIQISNVEHLLYVVFLLIFQFVLAVLCVVFYVVSFCFLKARPPWFWWRRDNRVLTWFFECIYAQFVKCFF